jgi:hypothetical protein
VAKNRRHRGAARQRPLRRCRYAVQQCSVELMHRNALKKNLRHADAHDCGAKEAMKV